MAIKLSKGQKIDLTKGNPSLNKVRIGLGWDINRYDGGCDFDLDASVFLVPQSGNMQDEDFVFYNNLKHPSGSVEHTGDNRTGEGDGDDEVLIASLKDIPSRINKLAIAVTIHDAEERRQNFGQVSNAYVRVVNEDDQSEILRYDLGEDFSIETAIVVCEIYRHNGEWKFAAIGSGFQGGLASLCKNYGLAV